MNTPLSNHHEIGVVSEILKSVDNNCQRQHTVQSGGFFLPARSPLRRWGYDEKDIKICTLQLKLPGKQIFGGPQRVDR